MPIRVKYLTTSNIQYVEPDKFNIPEGYALLFGTAYEKANSLILNWPKLHQEKVLYESAEKVFWSAAFSSDKKLYYCAIKYDNVTLNALASYIGKYNHCEDNIFVSEDEIYTFSLSPSENIIAYTEHISEDQIAVNVLDLKNGSKKSVLGDMLSSRSKPTWLSDQEIVFVCTEGIMKYNIDKNAMELLVSGQYSSVLYWEKSKIIILKDEGYIFVYDTETKKKKFIFKNNFICGPPSISSDQKYLAFPHEFPENYEQVMKVRRKPSFGSSVFVVNLETMEYTYYSRPSGCYGPYLNWAHISYEDYVKK